MSVARIITKDSTSMKKEKGEINWLVYMGKWQALVGVELKFCPWQRALSEHV